MKKSSSTYGGACICRSEIDVFGCHNQFIKLLLVVRARRSLINRLTAELRYRMTSVLLLNALWSDLSLRFFSLPMTLWKPFDNVPPTGEKPFTDLSRWRLLVNDGGRQTWHYLKTDEEIAKWPQTKLDKYWLGLDMVKLASSKFLFLFNSTIIIL